MTLPAGFKKVNVLKGADDAPNEGAPTPPTNAPNESAGAGEKTGADLGAITSGLVDNMSEVQDHVIDAHEAGEKEKAKEWEGLVDDLGRVFDPSIHRSKKDGSPSLSRGGKLIKLSKTVGRKGSDGSRIGGLHQNDTVGEPEINVVSAEQQYKACAKVAAGTLLTLGMALGGEEWQPINDKKSGLNEQKMLEDAFEAYFVAKCITDIPPSLGIAMAVGAYTLPRFTMPKTQTKVGKLKQWFVKKMADRKLKKFGMTAEKSSKMVA